MQLEDLAKIKETTVALLSLSTKMQSEDLAEVKQNKVGL